MSVNLEWYRVFYQTALLGSITRAAEALYITQPAVSQCIHQLEAELGTALFIRTPRGVSLTAEGRALYEFAARGVTGIEQGERLVRQMHDLERGSISIGASDMTLEFYLLKHLERFHKRYPGVRISVTNAPTPDTLALLHEGKIDFGAVSSPVPPRPGLNVRPVAALQDVFAAGPRFASLRGRTLHPRELCALPLICLEKNTSTRRYIDEFLLTQGVRLEPEFELATSRLIAQFAARDMGVGCLVRHFAQPFLESGQLFELTLSPALPPRSLCLVSDGRIPLSHAAQKLLEQMT